MTHVDFRDTPISDLIPNAPEIISVKRTDSIAVALKALHDHNVSSVGVTDDGNCFYSLLSAYDLMTYISFGTFKEGQEPDGHSLDTQVGDVIGKFHEETRKVWNFEGSSPMSQLLEPMSKGVHRAVVLSTDSFQMVSQLDVVRYGWQQRALFSASQKTVEDLGLGKAPKSPICTITTTQSALEAFRKMEMRKFTSLPVVDSDSGAVVSSISAEDIRAVTLDNLELLNRSTVDFLKQTRGGELPRPAVLRRRALLSEVMERMTNEREKHAWVVDPQSRPVGSVSFSDVIACMLSE